MGWGAVPGRMTDPWMHQGASSGGRASLMARSALCRSEPQPICTLGKNSLTGAPNGSTGAAGL